MALKRSVIKHVCETTHQNMSAFLNIQATENFFAAATFFGDIKIGILVLCVFLKKFLE